jgi:hypothetical protein
MQKHASENIWNGFDVWKWIDFSYFVLLFKIKLRFGILLAVCATLEDLSCNLAYLTQPKCFMDWSWLFRVAKWAQTQNYKPFHRISREILHRGYKTSFHFRRLSMEIRPTISLETNGSFFLYHIRCLFVFWHRLFFINI